MGLLFLQLLACQRHNYLLSDLLLDDLLCCVVVCSGYDWLLCVILYECLLPGLLHVLFLSCFLALLPLEGLVKWHFAASIIFFTIHERGSLLC